MGLKSGSPRQSPARRIKKTKPDPRHQLIELAHDEADFVAVQTSIVKILHEAFSLSRVNIFLYNKKTNSLETSSSVGFPYRACQDMRTPVVRMDGNSSRAAQVCAFLDNKTVVVRHRENDPDFHHRVLFPYKTFSREFAIFPLRHKKRKLGVLSIAVDEANSVSLVRPLIKKIEALTEMISGMIHAAQPIPKSDRQIMTIISNIIHKSLIYPVFQPIVDPIARAVTGQEVLLRAKHPFIEKPLDLLGHADKFNSLRDVSRIIHTMAIKETAHLDSSQKIFLNLHPRDFREYADLAEPMNPFHGLDASRFVLEITEQYLIDDMSRLNDLFRHFKKHGFGIAIDDLGSGYSTLGNLTVMEPDYIKFDMSLIRDIDTNERKQKLVRSLIFFCNQIDCRCIAEGVETRAELETLLAMKCRLIQGYYVAYPEPKPLSQESMRQKLKQLRSPRPAKNVST